LLGSQALREYQRPPFQRRNGGRFPLGPQKRKKQRNPHPMVKYALTTNNQQPTTNNQQPTTNNQQPTTNNQQPTTNNQQPTTNNQHKRGRCV
jgi:hypothetical protein